MRGKCGATSLFVFAPARCLRASMTLWYHVTEQLQRTYCLVLPNKRPMRRRGKDCCIPFILGVQAMATRTPRNKRFNEHQQWFCMHVREFGRKWNSTSCWVREHMAVNFLISFLTFVPGWFAHHFTHNNRELVDVFVGVAGVCWNSLNCRIRPIELTSLKLSYRLAVDRHALSAFVVVLESTVNGDLNVRERLTAYYSQMFRQECCKKASF